MPSILSISALIASIGAVVAQAPEGSQAAAPYSIPPLSEITKGAPAQQTPGITKTWTPGSPAPTYVPGAPAIPKPQPISNYPTVDKIPPTDSPEVKQWISQIDWSKIPTFSNTTGECGTSPEAAKERERCWWTCTSCTRPTDITECPDKMTWGLSFDDGPSEHTPVLLNYLNQNNITTTWFLVGSRVIELPEIVVAQYQTGHQLSGHTWSHHALTSLTNEQIVAELGWTSKAMRDVTGVTPNTFRPPFGDIDDRVRAIAAQMGLTPIMWTGHNGMSFDTNDWSINTGKETGESTYKRFQDILTKNVPQLNSGFIVLEHDLYQYTVDIAVGYLIPLAIQSKFLLQSVSDCLKIPLADTFHETSRNLTTTQITAVPSGTFFQPKVGPQATSTAGHNASASAGGNSTQNTAAPAAGANNNSAWNTAAPLGLVLGALAASMVLA